MDFSNLDDGVDWANALPPHILAQQERERQRRQPPPALANGKRMLVSWPLPDDAFPVPQRNEGTRRLRPGGVCCVSLTPPPRAGEKGEARPMPNVSRRAMIERRERLLIEEFERPSLADGYQLSSRLQQRRRRGTAQQRAARVVEGSPAQTSEERNSLARTAEAGGGGAVEATTVERSDNAAAELLEVVISLTPYTEEEQNRLLLDVEDPNTRDRLREMLGVVRVVLAPADSPGATEGEVGPRSDGALRQEVPPAGSPPHAVDERLSTSSVPQSSRPSPAPHDDVWEISDFSYENLLELGSLNVCTGLGKQQLRRLRPIPYVRRLPQRINHRGATATVCSESTQTVRGEECVVCLEELRANCSSLRLACGHVFHYVCLVDWLKRSNRCPTCRFEVPRRE